LDIQFIDLPSAVKNPSPVKDRPDLICAEIGKKRSWTPARDKSLRIKGAVDDLERSEGGLGLEELANGKRDFPSKTFALQIRAECDPNSNYPDQKEQPEQREETPWREQSKFPHRAWQR